MDIDLNTLPLLGLFALFCLIFWRWQQRFPLPHLSVSDLDDFVGPVNWRMRSHRLPGQLMLLAILFFALAFVNLALIEPESGEITKRPPPSATEGVAIYLVLDQSSSMGEPIVVVTPNGRQQTTKEELLKKVTRQFVAGDPATGLRGRSNDLIGLVTFARTPQVVAPLTLDHNEILEQLAKMQPAPNKESDGTAIGYAIDKTVNLIAITRQWISKHQQAEKPPYDIKNATIILITDGLQEINPLDSAHPLRSIDLTDAAKIAAEQKVRLYLIVIEPQLASSNFSAYHHILQKMAAMTGGRFFLINSSYDLKTIYQEIDRLEKSHLPTSLRQPYAKRLFAFSPLLLIGGMASLFLAALLQTIVLRRVP